MSNDKFKPVVYTLLSIVLVIIIYFFIRHLLVINSVNHSIIKQLKFDEKNLNFKINHTKTQLKRTNFDKRNQKNLKEKLNKAYEDISILQQQIYDIKQASVIHNNYGMYTNVPIAHLGKGFYRVGLLLNNPKNNNGKLQNTTILTLYQQNVMPERDWYRYKVVDEYTPGRLEIYLPQSITLLNNNDKIPLLLGFENKGEFTVKLDDNFRLMYLN